MIPTPSFKPRLHIDEKKEKIFHEKFGCECFIVIGFWFFVEKIYVSSACTRFTFSSDLEVELNPSILEDNLHDLFFTCPFGLIKTKRRNEPSGLNSSAVNNPTIGVVEFRHAKSRLRESVCCNVVACRVSSKTPFPEHIDPFQLNALSVDGSHH